MKPSMLRLAAGVAAAMTVSALAAPADRGPDAQTKKELEGILAGRTQAELVYSQTRGPASVERVIYGDDDRKEVWEYDTIDPALRAASEAACVVMFNSEASYNAGTDTYSLSTSPWTFQSGSSICPDEPFRGQPTVGFCSGFLVAPDVIVTAGHCVGPSGVTNAGGAAVAFGFQIESMGGSAPTTLPGDQVYFITEIIDAQLGGGFDYCVARLDRPVEGITPVQVRRGGAPSDGDPLVVVGHPAVLPKKISGGAEVKNANGSTPWFQANLDTYGGNSGSMVLNADTLTVEGILVRGAPDYTSGPGGCTQSNRVPDTGNPGSGLMFEEVSKSTSFADFIPLAGLTVGPTTNTVHSGPVGGPFLNDTTIYTLTNSADEAIDYTVIASGDPILEFGGSKNIGGTLAAGATTSFAVTLAQSTTGLPAGLYTSTLTIEDTTNGRTTERTHTLEVGKIVYTSTDTPIAIPDDELPGITSSIFVADDFCLTNMEIDLDITHTFRGDLIVDLTSPNGVTVRLHNGTGGSAANLITRYGANDTAPDGPGSLEDFYFQNATGVWTLTVGDDANNDIGTLNSWAIRTVPGGEDCPPIANDAALNVPQNWMGAVTLDIADAESRIITSLPAGGVLWEGDGQPILSTPHKLSGDSVIYRADVGFTGSDSFTFVADDGAQQSAPATVAVSVASAGTVAFFGLDSDPNWDYEGDWAWGQPTGQGGAGSSGPDPTSGFTGNNVLGYNLNGNYANNMPQYFVTTTPIAVNATTGLGVTFQRWLGMESATFDHASFQARANGGTWQTLYEHTGGSFGDDAWVEVSYDLSFADGADFIELRWSIGTTDTSVTYPGWNIDDIAITGNVSSSPADLPATTISTSRTSRCSLAPSEPKPPRQT